MPRIPTKDLNPDDYSPSELHYIYNGLDCCLTFEIFSTLDKQLRGSNSPEPQLIYDFERGMQAPALDMMQRGFKIDSYERMSGISLLQKRQEKIQVLLNRYANVVWGKDLNPNSPKQMKEFFYETLGLPEQHKIERGVRKVSTDRESLEKLLAYFYAQPIIYCVLALRDCTKKISVLSTEVTNGRMFTSYNVAGTETGRWSSSASAFGDGTNLQNITPELRKMFVADPGKKLCYLDLEQAESRVVGLLVWMCTGCSAYLDACESGDLHTTTATLVWRELGWADDRAANKAIAEQVFYRQFSYRDMAKRGGHGTNYYGTPRTMARHLKVAVDLMENFQRRYFTAFPGIPLWHKWVAHQLGIHQVLSTPLGRRRTFFGRSNDDATLREAIAFVPQSVVGDLLNFILWKFWKEMQHCELLAQIHDAIVFQYPEDLESEVIPQALALAVEPITVESLVHKGEFRTITIPNECKVGWNWADFTIKTSLGKKLQNPNGLKKWTGEPDVRKRLEGLARPVS